MELLWKEIKNEKELQTVSGIENLKKVEMLIKAPPNFFLHWSSTII